MGHVLQYRHKRAASARSPVVAEHVAIHVKAEHALMVHEVVVVGLVVYHLCHEQVERRHGDAQAEEVEQGCQAVAAKHI